ncbi:hypothetical protein AUTU_04620 [Aureibacter tunicatorum]|nr:hypothetical protein AUTU_04620 [Aureibacter tunicatorum]
MNIENYHKIMNNKLGLLLIALAIVSWGCGASQQAASVLHDQEHDERVREISAEDLALLNKEDSLLSIYRASATKYFDLLHTKLEVSFDWQKQFLYGKASIGLKPHFYSQDYLELDAKGFDINEVSIFNKDGSKDTLEYSYDGKKLGVSLPREFTKDELVQLYIDYVAKPNELEVGGSTAITEDKGLYFINPDSTDSKKPTQLWTQGETEASSCWFPTIDVPNSKTTQEIFMTVDDKFKTLSNGSLIYSKHNEDGTRTDYWKMDKKHAPYLVMMAVGDFAVVKDKWRNIPLAYYVDHEYADDAQAIFNNTPEMMEFFSTVLGYDYPWPKYDQVVVHDFVSGAMENTSASVFMEEVQMDKRNLLDYDWDGIIAHELFHHWFGDLVTCESWSNLPLNESFANYSEYLWFEHKHGKDYADAHRLDEMNGYFAEAESKRENMIRYHYVSREDMFDRHSYNKGGCILHMLRNAIGDEAFFASLQLYLNTHQYGTVELADLRMAFEKVTGQDLNWFFNQWFLASGHPELNVASSYNPEKRKVVVNVTQVQDLNKTPLYRLPLYVDVYNQGKKQRFPVVIDKETSSFEFEVNGVPDFVLFDGDQQLLGIVNHPKSIDELKSQYNASDQFMARYSALTALQDSVKEGHLGWDDLVLTEAFKDSSQTIREISLAFMESYKGSQLDALVAKVEKVAASDSKSMVRAAAINLLAELAPTENLDLFEHALHDSAYSVIGSALYGYSLANTNVDEVSDLFEKYDDQNNVNIILSLAGFYSKNKEYIKYGWFVDKIDNGGLETQWYLVQMLGELLDEAPEVQKEAGVAYLKKMGLEGKSKYLRLAALQSLLYLDTPETKEAVKELVKAEQDEDLVNYYSQMQFGD